MVKKKATRNKVQERKALVSSARAAYIEDKDSTDSPALWEEGMDVHVPLPKVKSSPADQEYQERRENARLTKKQKKRIEILKQRKVKKENRQQLYASLAKNQLTPDQIQVLQSSARMGQVDSAKQKLKLALKKSKLGLKIDPEVNLFQSVTLKE